MRATNPHGPGQTAPVPPQRTEQAGFQTSTEPAGTFYCLSNSHVVIPPPRFTGPTVLLLSPDGIWEGGARAEGAGIFEAPAADLMLAAPRHGAQSAPPLQNKLTSLGVSTVDLAARLKVPRRNFGYWFGHTERIADGLRLVIEMATSRDELFSWLDLLYDNSLPATAEPLKRRPDYWAVMHRIAGQDPRPIPTFAASLRRLGLSNQAVGRSLGVSEIAVSHWRRFPPSGIELAFAKAETGEEALQLATSLYGKLDRYLARGASYWPLFLTLLQRPHLREEPAYDPGTEIGSVLRRRFDALGITQRGLADETAYHQVTFSDWLTGRRRTPEGFALALVKSDLPEDLIVLLNLLYDRGGSSDARVRRSKRFWKTLNHLRRLPMPPETAVGGVPVWSPLRDSLSRLTLTERDLSRAIRVHSGTVSRWVTGKKPTPDGVQIVLALAGDRDEALDFLGRIYPSAYLSPLRGDPLDYGSLLKIRFSTERNPAWREAVAIYRDLDKTQILRGEVIPALAEEQRGEASREFRKLLEGLELKGQELADILCVTEASISGWRTSDWDPPMRLIQTLKGAKGKGHALYLIYDLLERAVAVYRRRHPFWREALLLRRKMDVLAGGDRRNLGNLGNLARRIQRRYGPWLRGDRDLKPVQEAIETATDLQALLGLLQKMNQRPRVVRPPVLPLYQNDPLNTAFRAARERLGISQGEMATIIGIQLRTVSDLERGTVSARGRPFIKVVTAAQDAGDLRTRIDAIGRPFLRRPTPKRRLTADEWGRFHEVLHHHRSYIRARVDEISRQWTLDGPGDADHLTHQVEKALQRVTLRSEGPLVVSKTLIRMIVRLRAIDLLRSRSGLKRDEWLNLTALWKLKRRLGRDPTAADVEAHFHLEAGDGAPYITLFEERWADRVLHVEYDDSLQYETDDEEPNADEPEEDA